MHRVRLRWLLLGVAVAAAAAVLHVHRSEAAAAATTPYSRRTVAHDGRTTATYSGNDPTVVACQGYNENPTIGLFKKIHRTRKYHQELFTSNIAKFSSKTTNYNKVNTIGTVWYKRRYTTTTNRITDFPFNWEVKRVPLMCSCAVSKYSNRSKLSTSLPDTINSYSIVTDQITTLTHTINNNFSSTGKMTENDLCQLTSFLSTLANPTNQTFTNQISHRNQSTTRYIKNDAGKGRNDFKNTVSRLKKISSPLSISKKKSHTENYSHHKTKKNTVDFKKSYHLWLPTSLAYITKKRNPVRHTENHSNNYIESTSNLVCTMCSKPILSIHTLIKPKLTTTSHVSLKSSQMETTAVTT